MKDVLQAVLDYVETPQTDYALLVTGPWGCGKTYFWKKVIVPQLGKLPEAARPKRVLYTSLYGLTDTKDIDKSLFLQSYPGLRQKHITGLSRILAGVAESLGYVDLAKVDLGFLVRKEGTILCFDDLERSKMPIETALGYINGFVEHEHVKTVIICNEEGISDTEKKTYGTMKEKVVGFSITFKPSYEDVLESLFAEHRAAGPFFGFLGQNKSLISHLFHQSQTDNLRALRRALSALDTVFRALQEAGVEPTKVANQIIYAVLPTAFELYGRQAEPGTLRKMHAMDSMAVAGISLGRAKKEESYEDTFVRMYLADARLGDAVGSPAICDFLLTGFLDRLSLISQMKKLLEPMPEQKQRLEMLLQFPREMSDEEFRSAVTQVLHELEVGEIADLGMLVHLFDAFEAFSKGGLINRTPVELLELFCQCIDVADAAGSLQWYERLDLILSHPMFGEGSAEGKQLRGRVQQLVAQLRERLVRVRVQKLLVQFAENPSALIDAFHGEGESALEGIPVFHEVNMQDVAKVVLTLSNAEKTRFGRAMAFRYFDSPVTPEFGGELPALRKMRDLFLEACKPVAGSGGSKPMSVVVVEQLVAILSEAIKQLEQVCQKTQGSADAPAGGH